MRLLAWLVQRWFVLAAGGLMGPLAVGAQSPPSAEWPPMAYRLADAQVRVQWDPAHGLALRRVVLAGNGDGVLERQGRGDMFRIDREGTLEVINALYRMRFFDLPIHLAPVRSVFPKDDGSVGTQATRLHDATTTTVCFTLPRYEKCVAYQANPPHELEEMVRRLLIDTERRATPTAPPK